MILKRTNEVKIEIENVFECWGKLRLLGIISSGMITSQGMESYRGILAISYSNIVYGVTIKFLEYEQLSALILPMLNM